MAERRMFAKTIVTSDAFLDMPISARCLYFALGMEADDDGFVNKTHAIMRLTGATIDDLNVLISKKFIIAFEDGVIVIKHWKINNYLRNDRYTETKYTELKECLQLDENNAYVIEIKPRQIQTESEAISLGIPDVNQVGDRRDTQDRLGKDRLGKDILHISPSNDGAADTDKTASSSSSILSKVQKSRFDAFWRVYPKKVGKQDAQKAWKKIAPDEELTDTIIRAVETAKQKDSRFREERFIPHPATWLNAGSWENEYDDYFPAQEQPKPQSGDGPRQLDVDRLLAAATGRKRT